MQATLPVLRYDPRDDGARCSECPCGPASPFVRYDAKNPWRPVQAELNPHAGGLAVGEAPGANEEDEGRPWVGQAGNELMYNLNACGVQRPALSYDNALACRPPKNELKILLHRIQVANKIAEKTAPEGTVPHRWPSPMDCCWPRLRKTALRYENLLLLGGIAAKAFLGSRTSIMDIRGGPVNLAVTAEGSVLREDPALPLPASLNIVRRWKALPTVHPSFVLHARRWRRIFRSDLARAVRFFTNRMDWKPPVKVFRPSPIQLRAFLNSGRPLYVIDVETAPARDELRVEIPAEIQEVIDADTPVKVKRRKKSDKKGKKDKWGLDALRAVLRCIGIGDHEVGYLVPFLSIDGETRFYSAAEEAEIIEILRGALDNGAILKGGWNSGYYDRMIAERFFGAFPWPMRDGILDHRLVESEFPHSLGFVASIYTDAGAWKADHTATEAKSDADLWKYCLDDVAITAYLLPKLADAVRARGQEHLVPFDAQKQSMCVGLHKAGLTVDQATRGELETELQTARVHWVQRCRELAGRREMNPNSTQQVVDLLFHTWHLPIMEYTDEGEPSTADDCLIKLFTDPMTTREQRAFIRALRKVRKATKKIGTYILPARPRRLGGYTDEDGRLRTNWNAHSVVSGRLSASDPLNFQNQPNPLRVMYVAGPGRVLIQADYDQLELRLVTARTQAKTYLRVFKEGLDPHSMLAEMTWGDRFTNAPGTKKSGAKGRMRDLSKRICYAAVYGASVTTIHEQIVQVEDENEELVYADFDLRETKAVYQKWLEIAPEFPRWWEESIDRWRQRGYTESLILHRRRDCLDSEVGDEELNEIVNFEIQSTGADLIDIATMKLLALIPFGYAGPGTGLVLQVHDSLMFEVPEADAWRVQKLVTDTMTQTFEQLPGVIFSAEADIAYRWTAKKCKVCKQDVDRKMKLFYPKMEVCSCAS